MKLKKENTDKYVRAQKRLQEIKGFYTHLVIYLVINTAITVYKIVKSIKGIEEFWDFGIFAVWFIWGLGLLYHA
ncbi:2TM domain-containing protein [Aggregatimonas sangjinii]|uniref:2TM domain-containing protein n=1 Tax=Aggregatimonas sangjinii TaxID=2583587 RepID=A0A5B7SUC2_9FLAO|nr:2TM domain-containing protein [Aggregatimonas sangjinii]QCX00440.1 2TM domain-containing protein [Aggregatimonas sangjinii]